MIYRMETGVKRVFDLLDYQNGKYPQKRALNKYENGKWEAFSIQRIKKETDDLSCYLLQKGFNKGERILVVPQIGRPEWMIFDLACQQIGLITVPVHPNATDQEIEHIINETRASFCLCADAGLYYKFQLFFRNLGMEVDVKHLEVQTEGYFEGFKFSMQSSVEIAEMQKIKDGIEEDEIIAIMYTSGASGIPKGVILTHKNIVSNVMSIIAVFPLKNKQKILSFLPYSHILERTTCYAYLAYGVNVYFSVNRDSIIHDFKSVKPYFCTMVPRILEKMYEYLQAQLLEKSMVKSFFVKQAFFVASQYGRRKKSKLGYLIKWSLARLTVLNPTKMKLGGKLKCMAVGGAALRPDIARLFSAGGIKIREGYGLTETSPIVSLNRFDPGMNRFGTVGLPVPGVQVKIDQFESEEEGEILIKGANVTQGYYKKPELTKQAFTDDGWFRTGDVGLFVESKFLKITNSLKEIFKTSAGRYIAPQPLESHCLGSAYIHQCMIIGFQRPYVTALIIPNFKLLENWCSKHKIHWTAPQFMVLNVKVREKIKQELDLLNESLPNFKRVRDFVLSHEILSEKNGDLTRNFKLKRDKIYQDHSKEIEKMYQDN